MDKIKIFDYLNIHKDKDILKLIDNEKVYYSDCIVKINQIGKNQERNFILTNKHVYNFNKKKLRRKIHLASILGLSYSTLSNEFIIHGKNETYDYSYISNNKMIIIYLILVLSQQFNNTNVQICEINEKSLKNYVTYERDKKRNRQVTKMNSTFQIDTKTFIENNKHLVEKNDGDNKKKNMRMMSYSEYKDFIIMESKIKIEHFKIIKELSRDILGPLFLGKYLKDSNYYYLKSIKKDYILEKNLIDQIIIEKKNIAKY